MEWKELVRNTVNSPEKLVDHFPDFELDLEELEEELFFGGAVGL